MSVAVLLLTVTGALISLLLSVIAFFLKFLIEDFRRLQTEVMELKGRQEGLRNEIDRMHEVLLLLKRKLMRSWKVEE
ncbi:hypothetical protein [Algoriphagus formosus]|uniref:Uncharacterized protein n=1 Tax=Algoriphagus formosus TaxID=2007308 RepID=A0A4R5USF1_9BACT|nr:hypothetical protein [Algoriphagus aquimaris]TDK42048.1 hypothetical protein E1898_18930 [Algoriphagus aquimaris]